MSRRRTVVTAHTESFSKKSTLKAGEDRNSTAKAKRGIYALEACMGRHQDENNPACPSTLARREAQVCLDIGRSGCNSCVYARGAIRNAQTGTRE